MGRPRQVLVIDRWVASISAGPREEDSGVQHRLGQEKKKRTSKSYQHQLGDGSSFQQSSYSVT